MGRWGRSWQLVKLCWGVLGQDKELVVFPIVSSIAVVIVTATFIVPGFFTGYSDAFGGSQDQSIPASAWLLLILFYLVQYFVIIFFNAALVSAAMVRLKGGDPTLGDGLRGAWSHIGAILGWAAIAATVGLLLNLLRERGGIGVPDCLREVRRLMQNVPQVAQRRARTGIDGMIEHHRIDAGLEIVASHRTPIRRAIDLRRLGARERAHIGLRNRVATRLRKRGARDAEIGGAAGIGGMVHKAALEAQGQRQAGVEILAHVRSMG